MTFGVILEMGSQFLTKYFLIESKITKLTFGYFLYLVWLMYFAITTLGLYYTRPSGEPILGITTNGI